MLCDCLPAFAVRSLSCARLVSRTTRNAHASDTQWTRSRALNSRQPRLFDCVAGLRAAIGAPLSPVERAHHDQTLTATRAALDEATLNQCWEVGRVLTLEQAFNDALAASGELGKASVRSRSVAGSQ